MEDYKEKYENALEIARKINNGDGVPAPPDYTICEVIFPELKESEDERTRKAILELVKQSSHILNPMNQKSMTTWLEKQGEIKSSDYPYVPGWRENRPDNKPKIKHSILMFTTHGIAEGEWLGEEWCQYRWSCKIKDTEVLYWLNLSDLETLEKENVKQVEQKPIDNVEPKFKVGDVIRNKWSNRAKTIIAVDNYQYTIDDGMPAQPFYVDINEQDNWVLVEENPAYSEDDEREVSVLKAYIRSRDWSDRHIDRALDIVDELVKKLKSLKERMKRE